MLATGADGVTLFGTTGEGASLGAAERSDAISAIVNSGVDPKAITLGLCATAIGDVAAQVQQGSGFGITKFLLLPPFYFKAVQDAGLFDWHAAVFDQAPTKAQFILYHIPQITQVPLSLDLISRLRAVFPHRVLAVKDSAGHWPFTCALLDSGKTPVLVGDERLLHKAAALGAAGSICGMANLYPARLRALFDTHVEDVALSGDVAVIVAAPVVPALKYAMSLLSDNAGWGHLRAPLQPLDATARASVAQRMTAPGILA